MKKMLKNSLKYEFKCVKSGIFAKKDVMLHFGGMSMGMMRNIKKTTFYLHLSKNRRTFAAEKVFKIWKIME